MQVWDVRHALTVGIVERTAEESKDGSSIANGLLRIPGPYPDYGRLGRDLFLTRHEAVAAAEAKRTKKIASVRKQLAKLEGLKFA